MVRSSELKLRQLGKHLKWTAREKVKTWDTAIKFIPRLEDQGKRRTDSSKQLH